MANPVDPTVFLWAFLFDLFLKMGVTITHNELVVLDAHIRAYLKANPGTSVRCDLNQTWLKDNTWAAKHIGDKA